MAKNAPQVQKVITHTSEIVAYRVSGRDVAEEPIDQIGLLAIRFKDGGKWFDVLYDNDRHMLEIRAGTGRIVLRMAASNQVYVDSERI